MSFASVAATIVVLIFATILPVQSFQSLVTARIKKIGVSSKSNDHRSAALMMTEQQHDDNSRRRFMKDLGFVSSSLSVSVLTTVVLIGSPMEATAAYNTRLGGLQSKIRSICMVMDELQRDLMQERWDLVETYPVKLRSYVPVFTTYTDASFPSDEATDKALRVALRYEVGRFFASLERLRQATARRALDEAYLAYSEMALHFDRYLHTGNLYTYEDPLISTEPFFRGVEDDDLVYADPKKDPPEVRDLIVLCKGPDKGKTGIVIGIYKDGSKTCVVKLDKYRSVYGIREIRVVPILWAAKRLGEQDPDEVFLIPRKEKKKTLS